MILQKFVSHKRPLNKLSFCTFGYLRQKREEDPVANVFDQKTKHLQRERAGCAPDVDVYDYLKNEIGYRLADRIFDIKRKFKLAADHVSPTSVEELILCDSNKQHLDSIETQEGLKIRKQIINEENIEFEPDSLDLVISSLTLHWINDLPGAFKRILHGLKQDGVLIAAVFGGDTLFELRSSLQLAELERRGGLSPHISPFTHVRDIGGLLNRAGFTMLTIDTDEIVVSYPSMFELMYDLKGMAENNAAVNRTIHLNRETQFAAAAIYQELYGKYDPEKDSTSIPATFQVINMLGWKPHPKQPKPLERGTGQISLKELHRLDEIIKEVKTVKIDDDDKK
ncbi:hypothetical protein RI129_001298 [Pyrocoelia pectoralis]|uniref:NADH dehydrogenase [ubiquinone] 1 alpha subcomplex assembly factor 5 n=1 Tax=Pyrocoelia pectoralis TaxID=417401 RepID=A0AAN7VXR1_9COLE